MGISAREAKNQEAKKIWEERIKAREASGISVAKWCKENNICVATYNNWKNRLSTSECANKKARKVVDAAKKAQAKHDVNNVSARETDVAASIAFGGMSIQIHKGADTATIEALLNAMNR